jgi:hypothetical protein
MKVLHSRLWAAIAGAALMMSSTALVARADSPADIASAAAKEAHIAVPGDHAVTGTMNMEFATRSTMNADDSGSLEDGSPKLGVQDTYHTNILVLNYRAFSGDITRLPRVYGAGVLGYAQRLRQSPVYGYHLDLIGIGIKDPTRHATLGTWSGNIDVDPEKGEMTLGTPDKPMRLAMLQGGTSEGGSDSFMGSIKTLVQHHASKSEQQAAAIKRSYVETVNGKPVQMTSSDTEPLDFQNVVMAAGPDIHTYPTVTVTGSLDYDRNLGNYFANKITFSYTLAGKQVTDVVTGGIKWSPDANRKTNGKGEYEFNLRFNDSGQANPDAAVSQDDPDAFFQPQPNVASMTGTIKYLDKFADTNNPDNPTISGATYDLNAVNLTPQQVMEFTKLWLLVTGPTNDE